MTSEVHLATAQGAQKKKLMNPEDYTNKALSLFRKSWCTDSNTSSSIIFKKNQLVGWSNCRCKYLQRLDSCLQSHSKNCSPPTVLCTKVKFRDFTTDIYEHQLLANSDTTYASEAGKIVFQYLKSAVGWSAMQETSATAAITKMKLIGKTSDSWLHQSKCCRCTNIHQR